MSLSVPSVSAAASAGASSLVATPLLPNPSSSPGPAVPRPSAREQVLRNTTLLASVSSYCSPGEQKGLLRVNKLFSRLTHEIDYHSFHRAQTVEEATRLFEACGRNPRFLQQRPPPSCFGGYSPAWNAFKRGRFDVASFYIENGGCFEAEEHFAYVRSPCLYFDFPVISRAMCEAKWRSAETPAEQVAVLQRILIEACNKGNLRCIEWVIEKQRQNHIPPASLSPCRPLEEAIKSGFDTVVVRLAEWLDCSSIDAQKKQELVALAIEMGYPNIPLLLEQQGFPLAGCQERARDHAAVAAAVEHARRSTRGEEDGARLVPQPVNRTHHTAHGGDANVSTYEREYRDALVYTVDYIRRGGAGCNFQQLIENLGSRRRRMAILGGLGATDEYGTPNPQRGARMGTYYGINYAPYGERIRKIYEGRQFSIQVNAQINGRPIPLTTIYLDRWEHPIGSDRNEILAEIQRIGQRICSRRYSNVETPLLAAELGRIYWLFAHSTPFLRGTPTITAILVDALWILQNRLPPRKTDDLNCEALVYDQIEDFARAMSERRNLPQISEINL